MISLAWRNLFRDKIRFLISISGVAFSVFLILILLSLFRGWNEKVVRYIDSTPVDLWIMQEGGDDFFNTVSFIPDLLKDQFEEIENIKEIFPLVGLQTSFELNGDTVRTYIMGYDTESKIGGPMKVIEGKEIPQEGEIIIDKVFSKTKGVKIGDTLKIGDKNLQIVGLAEGGDLVFLQFSFMAKDDAQELFASKGMKENVNFYLATLFDKEIEKDTIEKIESAFPGLTAFPKEKYKENNRREINEIFVPILTVLVIIGFLVGLTVVGLMTYTSTVEKSKEYGILKAIGASNPYLYQIILQQSFVTGFTGSFFGGIITFVSMPILENFVPQFVTQIEARDIGLTLVLILVMSVLSAFIPVRRIAQIEPATVFK